MEPWHSDEEADAHEAEERRHELELQEILTARKRGKIAPKDEFQEEA